MALAQQNDPVTQRALSEWGSMGSTIGSHLGRFGGGMNGLSRAVDTGAYWGMDWKQSMGLRGSLAEKYGVKGADSMFGSVAGSEYAFGIRGGATAGAMGAQALAGPGGPRVEEFVRIMAKATSLGIKDSRLKEGIAETIASAETSQGLGRVYGGGAVAADLMMMGMKDNPTDVGRRDVVQGAMDAIDATTGVQGGVPGLLNRDSALRVTKARLASINKQRTKNGYKAFSVTPAEQSALLESMQRSTLKDAMSETGYRDVYNLWDAIIRRRSGEEWRDGKSGVLNPSPGFVGPDDARSDLIGKSVGLAGNYASIMSSTKLKDLTEAAWKGNTGLDAEIRGIAKGIIQTNGLNIPEDQVDMFGKLYFKQLYASQNNEKLPEADQKTLDQMLGSGASGANPGLDAARAQAQGASDVFAQMANPQVQQTLTVLGTVMKTLAEDVALVKNLESLDAVLANISGHASGAAAALRSVKVK
jgi:hypothetical protein